VLYAGTFGGGVFKTIDAGSSWIPLPGSPAHARALAIVPLTPSILYAGSNGEGVFKTTDGGATWAHIDGLAVRTISAIAVDPRASGTVYVGGSQDFASPKGLAKTTDGGETWKLVDLGPASSSIVSVVVDPSSPSTVYVAQLADSRYASTPTVMVSMDGGETWFSLVNSLPRFIAPTALAVDPGPSRKVYLAAYRTIFQSANGGGTWTEVTSGLTPVDDGVLSYVYAIAIDPRSSTIYAGTGGNGLFKTNDGGASWNRLSGIFSNLNIAALATDPLDPLTIYAAANGPTKAVYRTRDGGLSWTEQSAGIPASAAFFEAILVDPIQPSTLYLGTIGGGVLKSSDAGATWMSANTGLPPPERDIVYSLTIDPNSHLTLYARTGTGLFRSTDGATMWSAINSPPAFGSELAVAPTAPSTLYSGGIASMSQSADGGQS
ncbi:MAG TPA: hypothetical protein VN971_03820, partial [Thermoanaerobaculia bacterium]|nr:hypothetical protein [Thermoanaerobaculia bacterium]